MADEYDMIAPSRRISKTEVRTVTARLLKEQGGVCPLCQSKIETGQCCLDHDHTTGEIRGVLCRNCNGLEGRVRTRAIAGKRKLQPHEWLQNVVNYWKSNATPKHNLLYYTYKTAEEKRLERNAKARAARAASKAAQNLRLK